MAGDRNQKDWEADSHGFVYLFDQTRRRVIAGVSGLSHPSVQR